MTTESVYAPVLTLRAARRHVSRRCDPFGARGALSPVDVGASFAEALPSGKQDSRRRRRGRASRAQSLLARLLAGTALVAAAALPAVAQDATWLATPGTGDFNTGANWNTATVPTGTAFFDASTITGLSFSANTTVGGFTFNAGASAYTFTNDRIVQFNGAGIVVSGGSAAITNNPFAQLTFANTSSAGSATIANNGTLIFVDTSTAGSAFISNNRDIFFADSSTAGTATITNNSGLGFFNTSSAGSATITNTFSGTLSFGNNSSAGSATIANSNVLNFFDASTAGSATISNNFFGNLRFFGASTAGTATITNDFQLGFFDSSTAGSATISNGLFGILSFFDASTAGTATIANTSGSLRFVDTSTAGTATIVNDLGGAVTFVGSSTAGAATITNNSGVVQFINDSSAGSAAITNNSSLQFLENSTADSAAIANNGSLAFFGTSTAGSATVTTNSGLTRFVDGSTGGNARFITGANGAFDISQLGSAGMTAGSIEGAGAYFLGSKTLTVGGNNLSTEVGGVIQDGGIVGGTGGALVKEGTGSLLLSGNNTYTGATTVNAGSLIVNGSIASSSLTTVNAGGTLGGNGTVGDTTITGGMLSPGNSIGTLTVQGNLVMTAAAAYVVEVVARRHRPHQCHRRRDARRHGAGSASARAASSHAPTPSCHADGGRGGSTFGALTTTGLPAGFAASLSYTSNDVILNLTAQLGRGRTTDSPSTSGTWRTRSTISSTTAARCRRASCTLFGLTGGNLANALTLLSGEAATGAQQGAFQLTASSSASCSIRSSMGAAAIAGVRRACARLCARARGAAGGDRARLRQGDEGAGVQGAAAGLRATLDRLGRARFGGYNKTDGDPAVVGCHDLTARTAGFAAGIDYRVTPDTVVGFALAGGGTNWSLAQGLGGGRSDAFQAGLYARDALGPRLSRRLARLRQSLDVHRPLRRLRRSPHRRFRRPQLSAAASKAAIASARRSSGVTPYAARAGAELPHAGLQRDRRQRRRLRARLHFAHRAPTTRSELGSRFDQVAALDPDAVLTLRARARLGARLGERSGARRRLPGAAGHELHRQRRDAREGLRARLRRRRASPRQRRHAARPIRRRVRQRLADLCRHRRAAGELVIKASGTIA